MYSKDSTSLYALSKARRNVIGGDKVGPCGHAARLAWSIPGGLETIIPETARGVE